MRSASLRRGAAGFTLVELLVVIAIIGILVALLLPAVQAARESARRTQCHNQMKQLVLGCLNYHDVMGKFPQCYVGANTVAPNSFGRSWMFAILPYVEQTTLQGFTDYRVPLGSGVPGAATYTINTGVSLTVIPTFLCPSDTIANGTMPNRSDGANPSNNGIEAVTSYKGCAGSNWAWGDPVCQYTYPAGASTNGLDQGNGILMRNWNNDPHAWLNMSDVSDGSSNTFLIGEAVPAWCQWTWWWWSNATTATCGIPLNYKSLAIQANPIGITLEMQAGDWTNNYSFMSRHPAGANFAMADGHAAFVTDSIDLYTYRYLANRGDGVAIRTP